MATDPTTLTRRTLFTVGGLMAARFALPAIPGEEGKFRLFGPTEAAAEDKIQTFSVNVASETTVQFKVFDVAKNITDASAPGVKGVSITVTPLDEGLTDLEPTKLVTDANGFAMMDIAGYCAEVKETAPRYQCTVMIDIKKDGHQPTRICKRFLSGASLYALPCPSFSGNDEEKPHYRSVAFNGWDIQYSASTFMYSKVKQHAIPITLQLRVNENAEDIWVEFWRWRTSATSPSSEDFNKAEKEGEERIKIGYKNVGQSGKQCGTSNDDKKYWELKFEGAFLQADSDRAFTSPKDHLVIRLVSKKYGTYTVVTYAAFEKMPFTEAQQGSFSPFPSLADGSISYTIPGVTPIGNTKGDNALSCSFDLPKWPFIWAFSPVGYGMIGYSFPKRWCTDYNTETGKMENYHEIPKHVFMESAQDLLGLWNSRIDEARAVLGLNWVRNIGDGRQEDDTRPASVLDGVDRPATVHTSEENDDPLNKSYSSITLDGSYSNDNGDGSNRSSLGNAAENKVNNLIQDNEIPDVENENADDLAQLGQNLANDEDNHDVQKFKWALVPRIYVMGAIQVYGDLMFEGGAIGTDEDVTRVIAAVNVALGGSFSGSYNFLCSVGPVPFYVEVGLSASAYGIGRFAFNFPWSDSDTDLATKLGDFFSNVSIEKENSRLGVMINVGVSLAVACGVQNVANFGIRGGASMSFYIGLLEVSGLAQDAPSWHGGALRFKIDAGVSCSIFVQIFLFHFTYDFGKWSWNLFDTAKEIKKKASFNGTVTPSTLGSAVGSAMNDKSGYVGHSASPEISGSKQSGRISLVAENEGEFAYRDAFMKGASFETIAEILADPDAAQGKDENLIMVTAVTADHFRGVCEYEVEGVSTASLSALDDDPDPQPEFETIDNGNGSFTFVRSYPDLAADDSEGGISVASIGDDADSSSEGVALADGVDDESSNLPAGWQQMSTSADPGYDYKSTGDKLIDGGSGTSSLSGVGDEGIQCVSAQILDKVYSDGRPKFARVSGVVEYEPGKYKYVTKTAMFRISTVKYGDTYLPRLSVQYKNEGGWSKTRPVDFVLKGVDSRINRANLSDYDFDIDEFTIKGKDENDSERHYVAISLLSGVLEDNVTLDLEAVATKPVTSVLVFGPQMSYSPDESSAVEGTWKYSPLVREAMSWMTLGNADGMTTYGDKKYLTYSPVVSAQASTANSRDVSTIVISGAYLYRQVAENATKNKIFSDDTKSQIRIFTTSTSVSTYKWNEVVSELFNAKGLLNTGLNLTDGPADGVESISSGVTNVCMGASEWMWYADSFFGYSAGEASGIFGVHHEREYKNGFNDYSAGNVFRAGSNDASRICRTLDSGVKRLRLWNGHNAFFALKSVGSGDEEHKELNVFKLPAPYEDKSYTTKLIDKDITDAGLVGAEEHTPTDFFVTNDGGMLLYADNTQNAGDKDGKIRVMDEVGNLGKVESVDTYRIKAMRAIESEGKTLFTKPFVLAECDWPIDEVVAAAAADEATDIMFVHITDLETSQAEYRSICVPCVAAATPMSFAAAEDYATAGKDCTFKLELRNDGNTLLYGAHVSLLDGDNNNKVLVDELEIKFSKENIVTSSDAAPDSEDGEISTDIKYETGYGDSDHILAKDGGRNVVAPGKRAKVKFTYKIPEDWSGTRNLVVKTNKISYANPITGETATTASLLMSFGDGDKPTFASAASLSGLSSDVATQQQKVGTQSRDVFANFKTLASGASISGLNGANAFYGSDDSSNGGSNGGSNGSSNGTSGANGKSGKAGMPDTGDLMGMASLAAGALGAGMVAYSKRRAQVAAEEAAAKAEQNASVDEPADEV